MLRPEVSGSAGSVSGAAVSSPVAGEVSCVWARLTSSSGCATPVAYAPAGKGAIGSCPDPGFEPDPGPAAPTKSSTVRDPWPGVWSRTCAATAGCCSDLCSAPDLRVSTFPAWARTSGSLLLRLRRRCPWRRFTRCTVGARPLPAGLRRATRTPAAWSGGWRERSWRRWASIGASRAAWDGCGRPRSAPGWSRFAADW